MSHSFQIVVKKNDSSVISSVLEDGRSPVPLFSGDLRSIGEVIEECCNQDPKLGPTVPEKLDNESIASVFQIQHRQIIPLSRFSPEIWNLALFSLTDNAETCMVS